MFTNTSVVLERSISSTTGICICLPRWPPHEKRPGFTGSSVSMTSCFSTRPCTSTPPLRPSRTSIASSRLPSVALRPQTASCGFQVLSRASASCTCTPRLLPMSSCHSSTITVWMPASSSCACSRVSIRLSDSGVVTSTVGKRRSCFARSAEGVSPVRMPTVQPRARSSSGAFIARAESAASARIGVSQSAPSGGVALPGFGAAAASRLARSSAPNHTA